MIMKYLLPLFLATTRWWALVDSVDVGDQICIEGYVMDVYCIERGTLLDNSRVRTLEGPEKHTVHCLADVSFCYGSGFEILLDPTGNQTLYTRGWRLDEDGTDMVLELAREVGRCSTCSSGGTIRDGFRAALNVTVLDLGSEESPPLVSVETAVVASPDEMMCGETVDLLSTERPTSGAAPGTRFRRLLLTAVGVFAGYTHM